MPEENLFNPENFEHLNHAVSLFPDLEFATFATCYAEGKINFPVNNYEGLSPLFNDLPNLPEKIKLRKLTYQNLPEFFPSELFPINNIDDFLSKVFLSAVRGSVSHQQNGD